MNIKLNMVVEKRRKKINKKIELFSLTVMLAWMSYFLPLFDINLHVNSSTLAFTIWKRS